MKKKIIMDTSTLISLTMTCSSNIFSELKNKFSFAIPKTVYTESVLKPKENQKFHLSALRLSKIISETPFEIASPTAQEKQKTELFLSAANSLFSIENKNLNILQRAETEAAVLADSRNALLASDERTLRLLLENPFLLREVLEKRYGEDIEMDRSFLEKISFLKNLRIVRSSELLVSVFLKDKKILTKEEKEFLEASLFALKFAGASLTDEEIISFLNSLNKK